MHRTKKLVIMGVTSSGKSVIGKAVAEALGAPFIDGDDLHPSPNIVKMRSGTPLTDADRAPWLDKVGETLAQHTDRVVITCSALKRAYRDRIVAKAHDVTFILLDGPRELLEQRMAARKDHFMPLSLLDSQIATLEYPTEDENALMISIDQELGVIVKEICSEVLSLGFE